VLIIYLQYNYIASKLPLNWPKTVLDFAGIIQIFFGNGEGIFSVDCLLQARSIIARIVVHTASHSMLAIQHKVCKRDVPLDLTDVSETQLTINASIALAPNSLLITRPPLRCRRSCCPARCETVSTVPLQL